MPDKSDAQAVESIDELFSTYNTSSNGLSQKEAESRVEKYGYNELSEKHTSAFVKFLSYFWGPIPWMIEAAAVLSGVIGHWTDFAIILVLLVANAVVGFWEEFHADTAIEALKKKLAPEARVKRDGQWKTIPARELVPGDVVRLRLGNIVPADAVLLDGDTIEVDQSALTGESLPVERDAKQTVYSGSVIRQGEIDAVVSAIGQKTYFGKTAALVEDAHTESHFQKAVLKIGDYLIVLAVLLVVLIVVRALFVHDNIWKIVSFALVLTVAAIPVAMPTVLSVTMAVGARLLSAKEAIVRRLASIEEMAGVDVLCSDKTGTLTKNQLKLDDPFLVGGATKDNALLCAALASREEDSDPIDTAVLSGLDDKGVLKGYDVLHFTPFDPVHKRTEAQAKGKDGKTFKATKGAAQVILKLSKNADAVADKVNEAINDYASRGYRCLGVARADDGDNWQFLGLLPLYDPPRDDSKEVIKQARDMNVQVKMVTGDQLPIAREISKQLGLGINIVDASEFGETQHHKGGELADDIEKADGFAEVFPEHKYHIVEVLQQRKHIVGMTGDGVNDAPALKKADAGIAVSGATDAARGAADIVLTAPGLSTIIDAIKESRKIFQRMNSYATYRIAETIRVLLFMTLSIFVFNFYPVTAVMIVLLALLNDGAILSIAYDRAKVSPKPEAWDMTRVLGLATILGVTGVVESFGLFYLGDRVWHLNSNNPADNILQTMIYLKLSVAGHLTIFVTRTRKRFWADRPSNILIAAVVITQAVATLIAVYGVFMPALGWKWAGVVWGYALVWFLIEDQMKLIGNRIIDTAEPALLSVKRH